MQVDKDHSSEKQFQSYFLILSSYIAYRKNS